ncbi:hypothetical protein FACS1894184_12140 [Clostridia bacterium]|nr:hypothetical protein FACS1894184_12140 [Clostridia bacterium]
MADRYVAVDRVGERAVTFIMLLLGCAPAAVLLAAFTSLDNSAWFWSVAMGLYTAALALGFWSGVVFRGARLRAGLAALALLAGVFALGRAWTLFHAWWGVVFGAVLIAPWFVGLRTSAKPPGQEALPTVWMALAGAHALTAVIMRVSTLDVPTTARVILNITAPIYFLLTALRLNDFTLSVGAASRRTGTASPALRRRNELLVFGAAALTLIIANIGPIGTAVRRAVGYVLVGILWLFSKFTFAQGVEQGGGGGGEMDLSGLGEAAEPSLLAVILERVFIVIAVIIAVAAVGFGLYILGKKLKRLFKIIANRFALLASELNQGYTDEAERVFDWDEFTRNARGRISKLVPRRERLPKWGDLDNRARVRLTIRALLRMKPDLPESLTIRQALSRGELKVTSADAAALAAAYDAARYSAADISDIDTENARAAFEHIKR